MARYEITVKNSECEVTISTDNYLEIEEVVELTAKLTHEIKSQEAKKFYMVTVQGTGTEKIKTIKAVRQVTRLSLAEAKNLVEEAAYRLVKLPYALCEDEIPSAMETLKPWFSTVNTQVFD